MKLFILVAVVVSFANVSAQAQIQSPDQSPSDPYKSAVVYGSDNRLDLFEVTDPVYLNAANSVGALMATAKLQFHDAQGNVNIYSNEYGAMNHLCKDEKFYVQPAAANCSGFLVGPDLIATAGHCMSSQDYCTKYSWVFDFNVKTSTQTKVTVPQSSVYTCKEIVAHVEDRATETDFALVRLDRPVAGHTPILPRQDRGTTYGTKVVLAGYPSGLPMKLSEGTVTDFDEHQYWTNVDSFVINSGSLIFNAETGEAEGILVGGNHDYTLDNVNSCFRSFVLDPKGGQERVTRIQSVMPYLNFFQ
jgi:hypothetical protein